MILLEPCVCDGFDPCCMSSGPVLPLKITSSEKNFEANLFVNKSTIPEIFSEN